jgi:hypothetical protein
MTIVTAKANKPGEKENSRRVPRIVQILSNALPLTCAAADGTMMLWWQGRRESQAEGIQ